MKSSLAPIPHDLTGRTALVTGGGKGVGAAISRTLARRGAHVVVNYFHSPSAAESTVEAIRAFGGSARSARASVAKPEQVTSLIEDIGTREGGLDILVNNAARGVLTSSEKLTERDWELAFATNVHGARACALRAAPLLAAGNGAAIVNVSSIGAGLAMDNYMLVGVCKAALEALTRYLAADLGPQGVRVNTASAGLLGNATADLFPGAQALRHTCTTATPLGRLGTEEDLAQLVAFLASPQAGWISGQSYLADGGLSVGRAMLTPGPNTSAAPTRAAYTGSAGDQSPWPAGPRPA
ncbi:SDR family oxidoreductase [Streptomyces sp. ISL-11]|uniref:SDR family oxidoreductase n=1 Tax=Streptomyces sp. ISL-11 TaxID=2819174 RepID=UPI001BE807B9|nr:SDR family oxidoreductase [Streptomyces sp. ISL-11]MBT2385294.1 SDR family oxidoreductase [Streptomyces sp. ISL-11]